VGDLLGAIADVVFAAPFGIALVLVGSFLGWTWLGTYGAGIGTITGLATGLWLDYSNSRQARQMRLPVCAIAAATLLYAFLK
jgi:hypothetical protein